MNESLEQTYIARHRDVLKPIAAALERHLGDLMRSAPKVQRIDRIAARAKDPESFLKKARKNNAAGKAHYSDPLTQIQDQIGARIIVFYLDDIDAARERIMKYMTVAEDTLKEPESEWEFGYFGRHYVLSMPGDAVPQDINPQIAPRLFELQIRTLHQHAWSEANHDIVYKAKEELTTLQKRQCAFAAAQAWGADRVFQELLHESGDDAWPPT